MEYIAVSYTRDRFYLFFLFTVVNVEKFFREWDKMAQKKEFMTDLCCYFSVNYLCMKKTVAWSP